MSKQELIFEKYRPLKDITPTILKGFFSEEDLKDITVAVEAAKVYDGDDPLYKPFILEHMSRLQIEVIYPDHIVKKLEDFASFLTGENVSLTHNSYLDYDERYSPGVNPMLPPHVDSDNYYSKVTMDYLWSKNFDWAVVIEGKKFYLEPGDLLYFWGAGQIHWREQVILEKGQKTEVLTFHFSKLSDHLELNKTARLSENRSIRLSNLHATDKMKKFMKQFTHEKNKSIAKKERKIKNENK